MSSAPSEPEQRITKPMMMQETGENLSFDQYNISPRAGHGSTLEEGGDGGLCGLGDAVGAQGDIELGDMMELHLK